jgi:hypothetical protein
MSRSDYERTFQQLVAEHPPTMIVPRYIQLELEKRGSDQMMYDDVRVSPRFRCMGPTIVEWVESPVALPVVFATTQGIVRNVSRTGFSVLTDRQWFPEQLALLYLPIGTAKTKVIRAKRLGIRCYDIGMRVQSYRME